MPASDAQRPRAPAPLSTGSMSERDLARGLTRDHQERFGHALAALTQEALAAILSSANAKVAILPLGATGPRGPHLRLDTDTLLAEDVARRAATELAARGFEAVWFPPTHGGAAGPIDQLPGGVGLPSELVSAIVLQTALAARRMGFDRVVALVARPEPSQLRAIRAAAASFREETGETMVFVDPADRRYEADLPAAYRLGRDRGGAITTSLMLAAHPDGVVVERAADLPPTTPDEGLAQGYVGHPANASLGEGMEMLDLLADLVVRAVEETV